MWGWIILVIMDGIMLEIKRILSEQRNKLYNCFVLGSIDFLTDPHCKESFAAFAINLVTERYELSNGISLFMSRHTKTILTIKCGLRFFLNWMPILANADLVMNFEHSTRSRLVKMLWSGWKRVAIKSLHEGSNAIGSVSEYEVVTCSKRPNNIKFDVW